MEKLKRLRDTIRISPREKYSPQYLKRHINIKFALCPKAISEIWNATTEKNQEMVLFAGRKKKGKKVVSRIRAVNNNPDEALITIRDPNPSLSQTDIIYINPDGSAKIETIVRPGSKQEERLSPRDLSPGEMRELYKFVKKAKLQKPAN